MVTGVSKSLPDMGVSYPDYLDWRAAQRVFVDLAARFPAGGVITGIGEPERVFGRYVTASFFSTLDVQPQIGDSSAKMKTKRVPRASSSSATDYGDGVSMPIQQ